MERSKKKLPRKACEELVENATWGGATMFTNVALRVEGWSFSPSG